MRNNQYQMRGRPPHAAACPGCGKQIETMVTRREAMACSLACRMNSAITKRGPDDCWEWNQFIESDGYGRFIWKKKRVRSHRVAYEMAKGPIPAGMVVMHACDNPLCCNPKHLSVGSPRDNNDDKIRKGRGSAARGEDAGHAILTDDAVRFIRSSDERVVVLADRFGVRPQCIYKVKQRIRWKHVVDHA